jgi:hypothetical protein
MSRDHEVKTSKSRESQRVPRLSARAKSDASRPPGNQLTLLAMLGSDFSQDTFDRHAAPLGDSRMAQPMYSAQRAAIVRQLQREYGNIYVQRLVNRIKGSPLPVGEGLGGEGIGQRSEPGVVQRADGGGSRESFARILQIAGQVVFHFNQSKLHQKLECSKALKLIAGLGTMIDDAKDKTVAAQLSNSLISYLNAGEHNAAMAHLQKVAALVNQSIPTLSKEDIKSLQSWMPKTVAQVPLTTALFQSLTPPAQAAAAPAQPAAAAEGEEEINYNTEEEIKYNTEAELRGGESPYGVAIPVSGAQAESPYGVPIPVGGAQESPYAASPASLRGESPYAASPASLRGEPAQTATPPASAREESPYGVAIPVRRKKNTVTP